MSWSFNRQLGAPQGAAEAVWLEPMARFVCTYSIGCVYKNAE